MNNKTVFIIAILILVLMFTTSIITPANAMSLPDQNDLRIETSPTEVPGRTLSVSGTGSVNLAPDIAHVNVGVHTENPDVVKAIDTNNQTSQKIKDILIKYGIAGKDIQTSNFSVFTNNQYDGSGVQKSTTFIVDNTLSVTVRDLNQLSKLIGEVTRNGANNINGIQFDVSDKSKALSDARKLAFEDARAQASEMAAILGTTLGEVKDAKVSIGGTSIFTGYGMGGGGDAAKANNVPISAGQLLVTVNLDVTYEIK